jgi:hypothetical protein
LGKVWSQWVEWENQFQQANLDTIGQYPTTNYRPISRWPLGSISRAYFDDANRKLYVAVNYPGQTAHIAAIDIDNGEMDKVCDIKGGAIYYVSSLAYDSTSHAIFYTSDNDDWRDLRIIDLKTGKSRMLQEDARIGDLVFNYADSSLWGIKHFNGISTIVRIPPPYTKWNQIYSWPYGTTMYDIDISPDGDRLSGALALISGRQKLITMEISNLMAGDTTYTSLIDFGFKNPANFVFSHDGKYLYGASYYTTGVSNIYRYDFSADSLEAMSNCETGFFRPLPISDDSLAVFMYTSRGFIPVMIGDTIIEDINAIRFLGTEVIIKYPEIEKWMIGSPRSINLDSLTTDTGDYNPIRVMKLVSAYPIAEGYKDYPAYGVRLNFSEPIGLYSSNMTASYTPNRVLPENQRFHVNWNFDYMEWNLNFKYNGADFYDLFGPTKTSRKGYSLGLRHSHYLVYDGPRRMRYTIGVRGYGGLEKLPDYQNVATSYDKFGTFVARLMCSDQRASLGAVDYEKGYKWQIAVRGTYVRERLHPLAFATFDFGIPLPIYHSSIWFRQAAGYSPGERMEPFDNFFFGGFGNNWIDYQGEKRYRNYYAFPGTELNNIAGINFGKVMAELSLPPLRFRHLGTTSFYLTWARMSLFCTGIVTNMDDKNWRREVANVGSQLDLRLTLLSHLRLTLSMGYAVAFEKKFKPFDEFMFSVKVL